MKIYRFIFKLFWLAIGIYASIAFDEWLYIIVTAALIAVSFYALALYMNCSKVTVALLFAYTAICFFMPAAVLFIPVLMPESDKNHARKLAFMPLIFTVTQVYFIPALLLAGFAYLCAVLINNLHEKETTIISQQDAAREKASEARRKELLLLETTENSHYQATLEERTRIARDIHDSMGHSLARCILQAGAMKASQDLSGLDELQINLQETMESIRKAVHNLKIEGTDLHTSLKNLCHNSKFNCDLQYDMNKNIPEAIKYNFLLVAKEAFTNTLRHSNASKITMTVQEHPALYQLLIKDNGTGSSTNMPGIGLANIEERIRELGGTCNFSSRDGFKIFITVPKKENSA